jgi:hypothetical protein
VVDVGRLAEAAARAPRRQAAARGLHLAERAVRVPVGRELIRPALREPIAGNYGRRAPARNRLFRFCSEPATRGVPARGAEPDSSDGVPARRIAGRVCPHPIGCGAHTPLGS